MKSRSITHSLKSIVAVAVLCGFAVSAYSTVLIDEQFESGYNRTANSISGSNMAWWKGRANSVPTVNVGSLNFQTSGNAGAGGYFGYFTDAGANIGGIGSASSVSNGHLQLGVGDVLTVSISFFLGTVPAGTQLRFGLFDNALSRSSTDLNGGLSSTAFTNAPGFAVFMPLSSTNNNDSTIDIRRHTTMTTANIFTAQADFTPIDGLVGAPYAGLQNGTNYTFKVSVARPNGTDYTISSSILDTLSQAVMTSGSVTTNDGVSSFDWIIWRTGAETPGNPDVFTELKVDVAAIPEPSTILLVGTGLGMALMAIRRRRS